MVAQYKILIFRHPEREFHIAVPQRPLGKIRLLQQVAVNIHVAIRIQIDFLPRQANDTL